MDALAIVDAASAYADTKQLVGTWRSCYSRGGENNVSVALPGAQWQRPLPEIVQGFVEQVLGVPPNHPHRHHPQYLFDHAVRWNPPRNDPQQSLMVSYIIE